MVKPLLMKLIDKDALVAEIEKRKEAFETSDGRRFHSLSDQILWNALNSIQDIINAFEVKEVNLDLDFEQELYKAFGQVKDFTLGMRIAKHFFELGLKAAQKGD